MSSKSCSAPKCKFIMITVLLHFSDMELFDAFTFLKFCFKQRLLILPYRQNEIVSKYLLPTLEGKEVRFTVNCLFAFLAFIYMCI